MRQCTIVRKLPLTISAMGNKGFTLIELMFTIAIIAVGLLAYIMQNIAISQKSELAFQQSIAYYDAQQVLENMRGIAQTGIFPANVTSVYNDGETVDGFSNLPDESVTVNYVDPAADPLDVTIAVTWLGNGRRNMTKELRTLLTQRMTS